MIKYLYCLGIAWAANGLTQASSISNQAPQWPNCSAAGDCLCSLQIGSQTIEPYDKTSGVLSAVDRTIGYKQWSVWSKQSRSKGVEIQYQDGYTIGTGFRKDQKTSMSLAQPGFQVQPTSIKIRWKQFFDTTTSTVTPYVCKLWITFSDGYILTDQSNALTDTNLSTMCDNYSEEEVTFYNSQRVLGFFGTSQVAGGQNPNEAIKYLGVYYESCKDPCELSQLQATGIADYIMTWLGQPQTQSVTISTQTGVFCAPLAINIFEGLTAPAWLSFTLSGQTLSIAIHPSMMAATDIGTHTLSLTAIWNGQTTTQLQTQFKVIVGPCQITSLAFLSQIPQALAYNIFVDSTLTFTPTVTQTPACQQPVILTTDQNYPWLQIAAGKLNIQTTDNSLHGKTIRLNYFLTPQGTPSVVSSAFFDVTFSSACATATLLLSPSSPSITAYLYSGSTSQTITITDSVSQQFGQLNLCGQYQISLLSPPSWLSQNKIAGNSGIQLTFSISSNAESDIGSQINVPYTVTLADFSQVQSQDALTVNILSYCSTTQLVQIYGFGSRAVQIGTQDQITFGQVQDTASQQHGAMDGLSFCKTRTYHLVDTVTQMQASFATVNGNLITITPTNSVAKGFYNFDLWTSLTYYPGLPLLKTPNFLAVTVLDCNKAIVSVLTQITPVDLQYNATPQTQSITLDDDNFGLCGAYQAAQITSLPQVSIDVIGKTLNVTVKPTEAVTAVAIIEVYLVPSKPSQLQLPIVVHPCEVSQILIDTFPTTVKLQFGQEKVLSLPTLTQIPDCQYKTTYFFSSTPGINQKLGDSYLSLHFDSPSMAGKQVQLNWLVQAGSYQTPIRTLQVNLVTGCDESVISIGNVERVNLTIGKPMAVLLKVSNSTSKRIGQPSVCGLYTVRTFTQSRRQLAEGIFVTATQLDPESIELNFNATATTEGEQTLSVEIGLADYPKVSTAVSSIRLSVQKAVQVLKSQPYLVDLYLYAITEEGEPWVYTLPPPAYNLISAKDGALLSTVQGDDCGISIGIDKPEGLDLNFDAPSRQISLDSKLPQKPGNYSINIDLSMPGDFGMSTNAYNIQLMIKPRPRFTFQPTETVSQNDTHQEYFQAQITRISQTGDVIVKFSELVDLPENLADIVWLTQPTAQPVLTLAIDGHVPSSYSWNVTAVKHQSIDIKVYFNDTFEVSQDLRRPDVLHLTFVDDSIIMSRKGGQLDPSSRTLHKALPPQISQRTLLQAKSVQKLGLTISTACLQNLIVNLILGGSLSMLWGLISSIQIIMHTLLFNISLPQTAQLVCSKFMLIASFNLIPTDSIFNKMFTISETQPPTWNYSQLGYNSLSLIHNLGTLFFILIGHLAASILYATFLKGRDPTSFSKYLWEHLFGGAFIRFFMESYLQVAVSVALNLTCLKAFTWAEYFQIAYSLLLVLMLVLVPALHFKFLAQNIEQLPDRKFAGQYGTVYKEFNIKINGKFQLAYVAEFMVRRLLLTGIIVCQSDPLLQVCSFTCLQMLHVCYLVVFRPIDEEELDSQEIQNEIITILCMYAMMGMTSTTPQLKSALGNIFIALFLLYICANAGQLGFISIKMWIRSFKIWVAKRKRKAACDAVRSFLQQSKLRQLRKLKFAQRLQPQSSESESEGGSSSSQEEAAVSDSDGGNELQLAFDQLVPNPLVVRKSSFEQPRLLRVSQREQQTNFPQTSFFKRARQSSHRVINVPQGFNEANVSSKRQSIQLIESDRDPPRQIRYDQNFQLNNMLEQQRYPSPRLLLSNESASLGHSRNSPNRRESALSRADSNEQQRSPKLVSAGRNMMHQNSFDSLGFRESPYYVAQQTYPSWENSQEVNGQILATQVYSVPSEPQSFVNGRMCQPFEDNARFHSGAITTPQVYEIPTQSPIHLTRVEPSYPPSPQRFRQVYLVHQQARPHLNKPGVSFLY